jgi:hypothetical protein
MGVMSESASTTYKGNEIEVESRVTNIHRDRPVQLVHQQRESR